MMADWFVLLVPFALLPVVLLFAFVGCQVFFPVDPYVPSGSYWPMVGLHYPPGLQTDVDTLRITFQFVDEGSDEALNTESAMETLGNSDIKPEGEFKDMRAQLDMRNFGPGKLTCTCEITKVGTTTPIPAVSNYQNYDPDPEESVLNYFELARDGDGFKVDISDVSTG
jgi:hypothetical protein